VFLLEFEVNKHLYIDKAKLAYLPTGRHLRCAGLRIPSARYCQPVRINEHDLIVMLGVFGLPIAEDD